MCRSNAFNIMGRQKIYSTKVQVAIQNSDESYMDEYNFYILNNNNRYIIEVSSESNTCFIKLKLDSDNQQIKEIMSEGYSNIRGFSLTNGFSLPRGAGAYIASLTQKGWDIFTLYQELYEIFPRTSYSIISVKRPEMDIFFCKNIRADYLLEQFLTNKL